MMETPEQAEALGEFRTATATLVARAEAPAPYESIALSNIEDMVQQYYNLLEDELKALHAQADAQEAAEARKVYAIASGYEAGQIDGKNAETRAWQERKLLAWDEEYQKRLAAAKGAKHALDEQGIKVKAFEMRLGLFKAWLYARRDFTP